MYVCVLTSPCYLPMLLFHLTENAFDQTSTKGEALRVASTDVTLPLASMTSVLPTLLELERRRLRLLARFDLPPPPSAFFVLSAAPFVSIVECLPST